MIVMNVCAKHAPYDKRVYDKIGIQLTKIGYEVHSSAPNIQDIVTDQGIHLHGFFQGKGIINRLKSSKNLYKIIESVKPDCMICHEPDALWIAYRYYKKEKKRRKIRLVFDCHEAYEIWFTVYNNITPIKIVNRCIDFIIDKRIKHYVKRIDAVTSVNHTMAERYSHYNINSYMIPSINSDDVKCETIIQQNDIKFVFYGAFAQSRQIEMMMGAAQLLKKNGIVCEMGVIGGEPDQESKDRFIQLAKNKGVAEYFHYWGWLDKQQSIECMKQYSVGLMRFDSYVMPGNYAMPNKLFEYMANGLAILGCKENVEIAKVVNENNCGYLIEKETAESLYEGIKWFLNNPKELIMMQQNGQRASIEKYNWNHYRQVLQVVVEGSKAS